MSRENPFARFDLRTDRDYYFRPRPPPGAFPSKFSALPGIGGSAPNSPTPGQNNQIVPFGAMRGSLGAAEAFADADRMRQLETRIAVSERSNRALLEEVVRLQSELKSTARHNDDVIREERQARQQLENSLRASHDLITQLSGRLKRAEDKVQDERSTLSSLMNQTKTVEQAVLGSQQELMNRRDLHGAKIDEMKAELDEAVRAKDALERVTYQLVDDMRNLKGKLDTQSLDFSSVANDLRHKSKKLEEDTRQTLESLRKQSENQSQAEQTTQQLRSLVEIRLSELRDVIVDLRSKQDTETQERRMLEQQTQLKMSDLQSAVAEQSRKREEAMHALEALQRDREHAADTERIKLQSKIAEIAEQVTQKILQKEVKIREETQQKFSQMEQNFYREQETRQGFEKSVKEEIERRFESQKKRAEDDFGTLKEQLRGDKRKSTETLHNLNKAMDLIEKQNDESKKQQEKLMSAEIKSRKQQERTFQEKMDDMNEKLQVATSTLQHAIGGMSTQVSSHADKVKRELKELIEDNKASATRHSADLDARLLALSNRLSQSEDMLEAKIATASAIQAQNIREKIESITVWQGITQQTIRELQSQNQQLPQDIFALEERYKLLKSELDSRLTSEVESRTRGVEENRTEIERLKSKPADDGTGASAKDIENCQNSIRKLAESIQTVKAVLGMKIQSEQKLRESSIQNIQEEMDEIQEKITKLQNEKADKEDDEDDEDEDEDEDEEDDDKKDDDKKDDEDDKKDDDKKDDEDDKKDDDDDKKDDDKKDDDNQGGGGGGQ